MYVVCRLHIYPRAADTPSSTYVPVLQQHHHQKHPPTKRGVGLKIAALDEGGRGGVISGWIKIEHHPDGDKMGKDQDERKLQWEGRESWY